MKHSWLLALFAISACAIARPVRPSGSESALGALAPPVTGSPIVPLIVAGESDPEVRGKGRPGAVWVQGYWHWDGVRYSWQRGRWEQAALRGAH